MTRDEERRYRIHRFLELTPNGGTISYPELMSDPKYAPPAETSQKAGGEVSTVSLPKMTGQL